MNAHDATEAAYKRGYEDGKRDAVKTEKMEVLFIGIEQPDRSKDLYTFAFDFELGGITYKYRENLTAELFENFGYEKVKYGRWERAADGAAYCTACKRKMNPSLYGYAHCALCGAEMGKKGEAND